MYCPEEEVFAPIIPKSGKNQPCPDVEKAVPAATHVPSPLQKVEEDALVPLFIWLTEIFPVRFENPMLGRSANTNERKVGDAAGPLEGPENTLLAGSVANAMLILPAEVTGDPVIVKNPELSTKPTLVTVPLVPPPACPIL